MKDEDIKQLIRKHINNLIEEAGENKTDLTRLLVFLNMITTDLLFAHYEDNPLHAIEYINKILQTRIEEVNARDQNKSNTIH